jgi:Raf kinase inhibitor-like YbhB/YbcL family protein
MKARGIVMKILIPTLLSGLLMTSCSGNGGSAKSPAASEAPEAFAFSSIAFANGTPIPIQYSGYGANESFPLSFTNADDNAQSMAIFMDDPDAPGGHFTHWLIWNIPPSASFIPGNIPKTGTVDYLQAKQGTNDNGSIGYFGPMPPSGTHTYVITVYTLDIRLDLAEGAGKAAFLAAVDGHIMQTSVYTGPYKK